MKLWNIAGDEWFCGYDILLPLRDLSFIPTGFQDDIIKRNPFCVIWPPPSGVTSEEFKTLPVFLGLFPLLPSWKSLFSKTFYSQFSTSLLPKGDHSPLFSQIKRQWKIVSDMPQDLIHPWPYFFSLLLCMSQLIKHMVCNPDTELPFISFHVHRPDLPVLWPLYPFLHWNFSYMVFCDLFLCCGHFLHHHILFSLATTSMLHWKQPFLHFSTF